LLHTHQAYYRRQISRGLFYRDISIKSPVEFLPSKQAVAGSSPVSRSLDTTSLFAGCLQAV
jgi:hypothetical protein